MSSIKKKLIALYLLIGLGILTLVACVYAVQVLHVGIRQAFIGTVIVIALIDIPFVGLIISLAKEKDKKI